MAFSKSVRKEIQERSVAASELTGQYTSRPLECAHMNHSRQFDTYNDPENAVYCSDIEHLAHHLLFRNRPGAIGLVQIDNERAINSLYSRVLKWNREKDLGMSPDRLREEISKAKNYWIFYLGLADEP